MSDKLLIIDGSSMLSTAFYGNIPEQMKRAKTIEEKEKYYPRLLRTSTGIYTNAIYPMLKTLGKILREQRPTHIVFCFDKSRDEIFRKKLYPDYKANRKETPEPLKQQFIEIEKVLQNMGFTVLFGNGYEADDYAGTIAKKFEGQIPIYLYTKDRDYLQLVSDHIKLWLVHQKQSDADDLCKKYYVDKSTINVPDKVFEYNPTLVRMEYEIWPNQVADLKGLQGDSSDNIPGIYGLSSAAPLLLAEYGNIEKMYEAIEPYFGDPKKEKELKEHWKSIGITRSPLGNLSAAADKKTNMPAKATALLSKQLATIKTDIELDITLDDLRLNINREGYFKELERLQIKSL